MPCLDFAYMCMHLCVYVGPCVYVVLTHVFRGAVPTSIVPYAVSGLLPLQAQPRICNDALVMAEPVERILPVSGLERLTRAMAPPGGRHSPKSRLPGLQQIRVRL
jgi:hypothetical protein